MQTNFSGFRYSPQAVDPEARRADNKALKDAGLYQVFRSEEDAQLQFFVSGLDYDRYYLAKTYSVHGVL